MFLKLNSAIYTCRVFYLLSARTEHVVEQNLLEHQLLLTTIVLLSQGVVQVTLTITINYRNYSKFSDTLCFRTPPIFHRNN